MPFGEATRITKRKSVDSPIAWRVRKLYGRAFRWLEGRAQARGASGWPWFRSLLWNVLWEIATPVLAVLLVPLFYWRLLTPDRADAATLPFGDFTDLHYPYRRWVAEELARGTKPYWNAFVSAGHSAVGDIQFHVFYPPDTWLAQVSGGAFPVRTLEWDVVGHVALGVLFTYLFARRLTGSRLGAFLSAIVFGFGGYLTGFPVQQVILLETSVWLPLALLLIDIGADWNSIIAFCFGAGVLAMAALAGHPQTFFYVVLASGLYALFKGWNQGRIRFAAIPGVVVLGLGAVGLAAVALIPAVLHLGLTDRTAVTFQFTRSGFALHEVVGLLFPSPIGGSPLYNGIVTWLLVAIAVATPTRRANKLLWVALGIGALLLSFGGNTFLQSLTYLGLGSFKLRDHERFVFLFDFAVAILAGYGAARLVSREEFQFSWLRRAVLWPVVGLIAILGLLIVAFAQASGGAQSNILSYIDRFVFAVLVLGLGGVVVLARSRWLLNASLAGILVAALVAFDLFTVNWQNNLQPGSPNQLLAATPVVNYLENDTVGLYRIASDGLLPGDGNAGALFRLQDVVGNSPLETASYSQFTKLVPEWTRWQVLDVRYIVTKRTFKDPRLRLLLHDGSTNLYELDAKDRLPRAYVVHDVVLAPDHAEALSLVKDVNLATTAVVEGASPSLVLLKPRTTATSQSQQKVEPARVINYGADALTIDASLKTPGLLVVSDIDYPGWSATVDGHPASILRADGIIRGVPLTAGSHVVRFSFEPPGLALGFRVSNTTERLLVGLIVLEIVGRVLWLAGTHLRPRRRSGGSPSYS